MGGQGTLSKETGFRGRGTLKPGMAPDPLRVGGIENPRKPNRREPLPHFRPSAAITSETTTHRESDPSPTSKMSNGYAVRRKQKCWDGEEDCGETDDKHHACCPDSTSCPTEPTDNIVV